MSTRSLIGLYDGKSVKYIYCHNNGYLSYNGVVLCLYYNSIERTSKLIELGDVRNIGYNLEMPRLRGTLRENYCNTYANSHIKTSSVYAYHRDGGEQWKDSKWNTDSDLRKFILNRGTTIAYSYYYDMVKKKWYLACPEKNWNDFKKFSLNRLLTDENYFKQYKDYTGDIDTFEDISAAVNRFKTQFKTDPIEFFNKHIKHRGIDYREVGYSTENGKKVYAVMEVIPDKVRRKAIFKAEHIGDCLDYIFREANVLFY